MVSASIITAEQLPTFGRLLFILGFDPKDILATAPEDGYFIYQKKKILANPPGPTMTPKEMVANTKSDEYNEVVLRSENLELQGIAVKHMIRHNGVLDTPAQADKLRTLAKERGLPVIELPPVVHSRRSTGQSWYQGWCRHVAFLKTQRCWLLLKWLHAATLLSPQQNGLGGDFRVRIPGGKATIQIGPTRD